MNSRETLNEGVFTAVWESGSTAWAEMLQGWFVGSTSTVAYICGSAGPRELDHEAGVEQSLLLHQYKMSKVQVHRLQQTPKGHGRQGAHSSGKLVGREL